MTSTPIVTNPVETSLAGPLVADLATLAPVNATTRDAVGAHHFTFTCFGTRCAARVEHAADTSHLVVEADLGPMPYSIDCRTRREKAHTVLRASRDLRHSRWLVGPTQRIRMEIVAQLARPLTPAGLLFEPLRALVEARPFIEMLRDLMHKPASTRQIA
jgi:hypothetical protein